MRRTPMLRVVAGLAVGILLAEYLPLPAAALWTAVGIGLMMAWSQWCGNAAIIAAFGSRWGKLLAMFIQVMFGIVIWPIIIRKTCTEESKAEA